MMKEVPHQQLTLNTKGLNLPAKAQRFAEWIKTHELTP